MEGESLDGLLFICFHSFLLKANQLFNKTLVRPDAGSPLSNKFSRLLIPHFASPHQIGNHKRSRSWHSMIAMHIHIAGLPALVDDVNRPFEVLICIFAVLVPECQVVVLSIFEFVGRDGLLSDGQHWLYFMLAEEFEIVCCLGISEHETIGSEFPVAADQGAWTIHILFHDNNCTNCNEWKQNGITNSIPII